ncbi:GDSL-type esterase/lipase family protein [Streptomyces sp. NPDC102360]|uniref:GDSL-type esterase/lipase family protein n=1 Tax=Streptomyces sp. NPDC102360 TaxID=3366160 RepID=UPI00380C233B
MVTNRPHKFMPMVGWGQVLRLFLDDSVEVLNCARGGASSKAFWDRGRYQWILDHLNPGDRVLVCLGQVDADKMNYTRPWEDYQDYVRACIVAARNRQAHPIVVLPHERRRLDRFGNLQSFLRDYRDATVEVAAEESVAVVDLYEQSLTWWRELGPDGTYEIFCHRRVDEPVTDCKEHDNTHLRAEGATECARFVVRALVEQRLIPEDWATDMERRDFSYSEAGWLPDQYFKQLVRTRVAAEPPAGLADVIGVPTAGEVG